jgi:dolichyl-phosphate-mannose-protein mannosyltransferase
LILRVFRSHPLWLILVVGLLHGLLYIFLVPPWQHYDEPAHFEYAWLLANRPGLPKPGDYDQTMRRAVAISMIEHNFFRGMNFLPDLNVQNEPIWIGISQVDDPPFYYLLASLPMRLFPSWEITQQLYAGRFVSLVLYLVSIVAAWGIMRELFPRENSFAWVVPASMALLPGYIDLMTAVNNDVGATVLFSLFLWGSLRMIRQGFSLPTLLWVLSAALLCYWTKNTVLLALPLLGLVILLSLFRERWKWVPWVPLIAAMPLILIAAVSWGDALLWIRSPNAFQVAPTRILSAQAPLGKYVMQMEVAPDRPSSEIFQLLPEKQVKALRGKTVTLGAWIWATRPLAINPLTLYDGQQSFSPAIQVDTSPKFFALSVVLGSDASHARVILTPGNSDIAEENTVFYDGLVLAEGKLPLDTVPQFSGPDAQQGIWGGQPFSNILRNASVEIVGPGIKPWPVESRPELLIYSSPELMLGSLLDWRGAGWYYQATAQNLLKTFWAKFGWGHVPLSLPFTTHPYFLLAILTCVGLGGAAIRLWNRRFSLSWNLLLFVAIATIGIWGQTFLRGTHSLVYPGAFIPGARYTYPVIVPTLLVLNAGWLEIACYLSCQLRLTSTMKYVVFFLFFLSLDLAALFSIIHYYNI